MNDEPSVNIDLLEFLSFDNLHSVDRVIELISLSLLLSLPSLLLVSQEEQNIHQSIVDLIDVIPINKRMKNEDT